MKAKGELKGDPWGAMKLKVMPIEAASGTAKVTNGPSPIPTAVASPAVHPSQRADPFGPPRSLSPGEDTSASKGKGRRGALNDNYPIRGGHESVEPYHNDKEFDNIHKDIGADTDPPNYDEPHHHEHYSSNDDGDDNSEFEEDEEPAPRGPRNSTTANRGKTHSPSSEHQDDEDLIPRDRNKPTASTRGKARSLSDERDDVPKPLLTARHPKHTASGIRQPPN